MELIDAQLEFIDNALEILELSKGLKRVFPKVTVETNYGFYTLENATWISDTSDANGNGCLTGMVLSGGETSRLLWATSFTDHKGTIQSFPYCNMGRMYLRSGIPHFGCTFC